MAFKQQIKTMATVEEEFLASKSKKLIKELNDKIGSGKISISSTENSIQITSNSSTTISSSSCFPTEKMESSFIDAEVLGVIDKKVENIKSTKLKATKTSKLEKTGSNGLEGEIINKKQSINTSVEGELDTAPELQLPMEGEPKKKKKLRKTSKKIDPSTTIMLPDMTLDDTEVDALIETKSNNKAIKSSVQTSIKSKKTLKTSETSTIETINELINDNKSIQNVSVKTIEETEAELNDKELTEETSEVSTSPKLSKKLKRISSPKKILTVS